MHVHTYVYYVFFNVSVALLFAGLLHVNPGSNKTWALKYCRTGFQVRD
jgi:hypothetical protein